MDLLHFREPVNAWTHGLWMLLCIPAGILLQIRSRGTVRKHVAFAIFTLALITCFFCSWLYHTVRFPASIDLCMRLDYMGIFLLIAGTTTPVMMIVMTGWWRGGSLFLVWGMAGTGVCSVGSAWPSEVQAEPSALMMRPITGNQSNMKRYATAPELALVS